jgi:uncharacterized membrane-anchored protein YitT (DUF2179 family)
MKKDYIMKALITFIYNLITLPGYLVLLMHYLLPTGGIAGIAQTSRHWRNRSWLRGVYTAIFYGFLVFLYLAALNEAGAL